jgi:hypothetical protein
MAHLVSFNQNEQGIATKKKKKKKKNGDRQSLLKRNWM